MLETALVNYHFITISDLWTSQQYLKIYLRLGKSMNNQSYLCLNFMKRTAIQVGRSQTDQAGLN